MGQIKDLTGQVFGTLQVLQLEKILSHRTYWKCKCLNCGKIVIKRQDNLKKAESCGCLKQKNAKHYKDFTGQKFGKLIALYPIEKRSSQNRVYWHCKCDCGNECDVLITNLQSGNTKSCGCLVSKGQELIAKILTENNIPFERQKSFENFFYKETNKPIKFDFFVNNEYIIEYDGKQHFQCSESGWDNIDNFNKTKERDAIRNQWCQKNNIPLIRIPYLKYQTLNIQDLLLNSSSFKVFNKL